MNMLLWLSLYFLNDVWHDVRCPGPNCPSMVTLPGYVEPPLVTPQIYDGYGNVRYVIDCEVNPEMCGD